MRISEIFYSLQGEGTLTGLPSAFIRMAGCPLRCGWCDTKYAWKASAAAHYSIEKIIQTVNTFQTNYVVITGGEPMVSPDLPALTKELKAADKHITIETAGIAFVPNVTCDLMSISPKLSNSVPADAALAAAHHDSRLDTAVIGKLISEYEYQLKFVVDSPADLTEIQQTIEQIGNVDTSRVFLMPQAATRQELLAKSPMVAELCKRTSYTFGQRLHVILWNNEQAT